MRLRITAIVLLALLACSTALAQDRLRMSTTSSLVSRPAKREARLAISYPPSATISVAVKRRPPMRRSCGLPSAAGRPS